MKLINGKKIAQQAIKRLHSKQACLAVILIGQNPASHIYVNLKEKRAKDANIKFKKYLLPTKTKQSEIIKLINKLNNQKSTTAILIQLPLPKHLNTHKIIASISPSKDADGIHPDHLNMLKIGKTPPVLPATTNAILTAIKATGTTLKNKSVAIIGKSEIVGLPTYYYLKNKVKKIDIYDSHTTSLPSKTKQADILVVAIGKPNFITNAYIKPHAIVIDVGINKIKNKTIGDVNFKSIKNKAAWITPVPGGIGPLTIIQLLKNVLKLSK